MQEKSKNVLTRESCKNELKRVVKANLMQESFILAAMLLIILPMYVLLINFAQNIFILVIILVFLGMFPIMVLYRIIRDVIFFGMIEKNKFFIVKDTVSRISRDECPGHYLKHGFEGRYTVNVIYFTKYGRCAAPKLRTPFDISGVDDEFYLVLSYKKDEIILAYNSVMYDCKELSE